MKFNNLQYYVSMPDEFCDEKIYPVVIFMHGAGTRGNDLNKVSENPFFCENNILMSEAIIYAPLCNEDTWFELYESVRDFVKHIYEHKNTDKSRVYLVGASMGGYAVWQMLMSDPHMYAGAIPVCGGGMYWNAGKLKDVNVWAFHGKKDCVVLCEESIKMVDAINRCGGNAKLTILDEYEHNSWDYVYNTPEVFKWLLNCKNKSSYIHKTNYDSSKLYG